MTYDDAIAYNKLIKSVHGSILILSTPTAVATLADKLLAIMMNPTSSSLEFSDRTVPRPYRICHSIASRTKH